VLAEDTRRTGLLFKRLGIEAKGFTSLHDHNEEARIGQVLSMLGQGMSVALVSDAGTPLISDPGYRLVRAVREAGFAVSPVPGPSAAITALSAAGLPPQPHVFLGFLPRKQGERKKLFETYAGLPASLVFYERKDRLEASLESAHEALGPREACIARELTKEHEQFILTRLDEFRAADVPLLGEFTVIIGPPVEQGKTPEAEVKKMLAAEAESGDKPKAVARRVHERVSGWTNKQLYEALLALSED